MDPQEMKNVSEFGDQIGIPCSLYRGGTSKGVFFMQNDLPKDKRKQINILLKVMGSPDHRQIDGLGGADPLTSRIGIISKNASSGKIEFQFGLVHIKAPVVDLEGFCGNMIAAVGPFAINQGLIPIQEPLTTVPIFDINTQMDVVAEVKIKKRKAESSGDFHIAGVPYPGSKIKLHFCRPCGLSLKPLLPTGQVRDVLETSFGNIEVSLIYCIDPVIFVHAQSMGLQGKEMPEHFSKIPGIFQKLEELRQLGSQKMNLAYRSYLPKIALIAAHPERGTLYARMLSLGSIHKAFAVSCASCAAAAACLRGSLAHELAHWKGKTNQLIIDHPQGKMEVGITMSHDQSYIEEISIDRTARCLMNGNVYLSKAEESCTIKL